MGINKDFHKMEQELINLRTLSREQMILHKLKASTEFENYKTYAKMLQRLIYMSFMIMTLILINFSLTETFYWFAFCSLFLLVIAFAIVMVFCSRKSTKRYQKLKLIEIFELERSEGILA
ncbi:hypothetical protein [Paenibacillus sp. FSL L8-0709]|uniref:hypothetical protein n=1 Tax=Paenibacillus sp. FSL L8-0709 TaxID=2975312 RepID=UPI0030F7CF0D